MMLDQPWLVCQDPDRPLAFGASFCPCETCEVILERIGRETPDQGIGLKFGMAARVVVDAGILAAGGCAESEIVHRFGENDDDWLREVWVARDDDAMSPAEDALLRALSAADIPAPEWNVEIDAEGQVVPAPVRRVT